MDRLRSKDELAGVIAHEMGHVVARHIAERITEQSLFTAVQVAIMVLFNIRIPAGTTTYLFTLPHSRRNESEADAIGVELMARACYHPDAMISVFDMLDRLEKDSGVHQHELCRTHPLSDARARALKVRIARGVFSLPIQRLGHPKHCLFPFQKSNSL